MTDIFNFYVCVAPLCDLPLAIPLYSLNFILKWSIKLANADFTATGVWYLIDGVLF